MKRLFIALAIAFGFSAYSHSQTVLNHDFSSVAQFESYTVIDANEDGQTWKYDDLFLAANSTRDYDADDWLITPALQLDATKTYKLTFNMSVEQEGNELLNLMIGQGNNAAALNKRLAPASTISNTNAVDRSVIFTVNATGTYYIGFHHATLNEMLSNTLLLNRVKVEETIDQGVPQAVSELKATAAANGELTATISFVTPTLNVGNKTLTQLTKVDLYRDGQRVTTFNEPGFGQTISYDDLQLTNGRHTYKVVPINDKGEGLPAETSVWVGNDLPGTVQNLRFEYNYDTHEAHITWDAPTVGANGGTIDPSALTYNIRRFHSDEALATDLTSLSFDDVVSTDFLLEAEEITRKRYEDIGMPVSVTYVVDGEGIMQYYVQAVSAVGKGSEIVSNSIIIGESNTLPYKESFANGALSHYWRTDIRSGRARWSAMGDSRFNQDGDGGMLGFNAIEGNEMAMCHSGNIDMSEAVTPMLIFHYFYGEAMAKPLQVKMSVDGGEFTTIASIDLTDEQQKKRYLRAAIPLTGAAGHQCVQVGFEANTTTTADVIYIDNVNIIDQRQYDLKADIAALPRILKVGQTGYLTATVTNLGTADVATGQYTVDVYVDNVKAGSSMGTAVAAEQSANVLVTLKPTIDMQTESEVYAEVVYTADEMPGNNRSDVGTLKVKQPIYPEPQELKLEGNVLSWQAPAAPRTEDGLVTESFEDYDDFQRTNFGEWTLYDLDLRLTYGIGGWRFPKNSDIQSYMIWNPSEVENIESGSKGMIDQLWYPRTGNKSLASFDAYDAESNDWLVSPELSGNAQVVSFYAHSMPKATRPDQFIFYISSTGIETTNFMALDQVPRTATSNWDKYEYTVPEGSKYFAIRKITNDGWVLFIDDITFAPDTLAALPNLMLYGYNVYRNGQRINTALVSSPTFTDSEAADGDSYRITAVYNEGESKYSNESIFSTGQGIVELNYTDGQTKTARYDLMGRKLSGTQEPRGLVVTKQKKYIVR